MLPCKIKTNVLSKMNISRIKTKKGTHLLLEPGIIQFTADKISNWDIEDAKESHQANLTLSKGGKYCLYVSASIIFNPDTKAKEFVDSKICTDYRIALAYAPKSIAMRLIAQSYLLFIKNKSTSRVFQREADALQWLRDKYKEAIRSS